MSKKNELTVVTGEAHQPSGPVVPGLVTVRVLAARGIQSNEMLGKPDSYVVVTYAGQSFKTKVVDDSEEPAYNEDIVSTAGLEEQAFVDIAVMEKYTTKDQLLGAMRFPVEAFAYNVLEPSWFELERDGEVTGEIWVAARFTPMALPGGLGAGGAAQGVQGSGPIEHMAQYLAGPRPWFMRGGYYYDLSKRVYRRVKALPVLSLTASVSESVVEGVLSRTVMRHPAGAAGAVAESSVARLDHVVTGLITTIDSGIDQAKDSVLRKAVDIKQRIAGQQQQRAAMAAAAAHQQQQQLALEGGKAAKQQSSGRIWWAIEGTVHNVARPVWSYVPIVGGLVVRTLDYVVPPPAPAPATKTAIPTATVIATPVGGDDKGCCSAFDPVVSSKQQGK